MAKIEDDLLCEKFTYKLHVHAFWKFKTEILPYDLNHNCPFKITYIFTLYFIEMEHIYWMDSKSQSISRIGRDLMERETIVDDDIGSIVDIAVDWIAGTLMLFIVIVSPYPYCLCPVRPLMMISDLLLI